MRGYNQSQYNTIRYNSDGTALAFAESMTPSDGTITKSDIHTLADFLFTDEFFEIELTNKALYDVLRLSDWLSIERNPANSQWYS